jgi:isopentenyl diphosphate isomerase/L-lactate dehydrogenase-like FMN-dependent dehydrogenase
MQNVQLRTESTGSLSRTTVCPQPVANHLTPHLGGRQIDGEITTMDALRDIIASSVVRAAQADGAFTVFLNSGVRTGTDILKAVALGADTVFCALLPLPSLAFFKRLAVG